ncbi:uncharacterized protein LOC142579483 [Dermacentor variabilis]|uniref:uncharacterized protein LOC142579483 n=1 Tax=Dermacentor variabilis TaxID=34621 RepID=UPI003F5B2526
MSSAGAAFAALAGRGNRSSVEDEKDYEIVLPTLPTGRVVLNTLFLHGDVRVRPYRVEDFRDALSNAGVLPEVVALGAYQVNHVWAVTFNSTEATRKLAAFKELQVKGRRCIVIDPEDQQVKLRLHWMLHGVQDEDIRTAFAAFGNVTEVTRERWRVQGMREKGSTTRTVLLKLKPGMKVNDLPHQVRVAGELALVVVPGRPMQCLRCHGTGHIRRDCKVPRCSKCRRYGHADADCVRTYAPATGQGKTDEIAELMDVVEAEDAARGTDETGKQTGLLDSSAPTGRDTLTGDGSASQQPADDLHRSSETTGKDGENTPEPKVVEPKGPNELQPDKSGARTPTSVSAAAKRSHAQTSVDGGQTATPGAEEPPAKAPQGRRSSFRLRPNVPVDQRAGNSESLGHAHVLPPDRTGGDGGV